ncbi:MAG: ribosomal RNA small subunit methyltransferase A [candidate division WOR-3 bacterium]|nr:MAG: ribosomal RNA small subunit methyltransferase A [candidate division WOR-3 bacterium]
MKPFRPRRSLGQSFLRHNPTADRLVGALELEPGDVVLEIGPGQGVLTRRLLGKARRVVAVEIDRRLIRRLGAEFGVRTDFELVHADFLEYDLSRHRGIKVLGNLPYKSCSQILVRMLGQIGAWRLAVLTTQREFAGRVLASPGTKAYGALSVMTERICHRERLFNIRAERFRPKPDVMSTAFRLVHRKRPLYEPDDPELFRRLVRSAFAHRRKTLANNLLAEFGFQKDLASGLLAQARIGLRDRAEAVDLEAFVRLYELLRRPT